ncbi:LabA-like NYN domain-containing protein [Vibrio agarivorans]|uniref:LabA-like NYN domain-containing protein n=1 Tax=Vibrio agarivorans TaxID=153622 RepID=UPI0022306BEC|nr:NYN domain-containing protein [Vibrio agarivorans]MDN3662951.1 NYN domain-containing protein [Vibrio agarivorans]
MLNKPNAAIFVDVQNIYYTTREAFNRNFDYNVFWREVEQEYSIEHAYAYAIASKQEKQRQFHHILRGIGFQVKLKPFTQRSDGSTKGDWDVGIALDVFETANQVDTVILLSGDGDFDVLAERIQQRFGVKVIVYSVKQLTAQSLIDQASQYVAIEDHLLL